MYHCDLFPASSSERAYFKFIFRLRGLLSAEDSTPIVYKLLILTRGYISMCSINSGRLSKLISLIEFWTFKLSYSAKV